MSKKVLTISLSAVCAVMLGVIAVLIVLATLKNHDLILENNESSVFSEVSGPEAVSSEVAVPVSTPDSPGLVISSPQKRNATTTEPTWSFIGTSDPNEPLTVNGTDVVRDENGTFTYTVELKPGKNTFDFVHKGQSYVYTVNYRYVIISDYTSGAQTYSSDANFSVNVTARKGSIVTATFNGQTITLKEQVTAEEVIRDSNVFVNFSGTFTMPHNSGFSDINCGKITYTATYDGKSETFYSGNITCQKPAFVVEKNPDATPKGGRYVDVGTGKITEIVAYEAETFDAFSTDDLSRPTNNYLPQGTVDYSAQAYAYYKDTPYSVLRCGYEVYVSKKDKPYTEYKPVIKEYQGTLPDHNEIEVLSLQNGTDHTTLKIKPLWKAPFYFDLTPQSYANPAVQDYRISSATYNCVDITFCYSTVFNGELVLPENNPLFSSVELIPQYQQNGSIMHYIARFHLKKQGAFYGWDANYDSEGNLVFEFLNPARVTAAANGYGADLTGVRILIDVGHGGVDCGATGFDVKNHSEAIQNLYLANKLKAQLESIGAMVYMTRTDNSTSSSDAKITKLKGLKPDLCIAIHHDSSTGSSANGFGVYYSQPFSKKAAEYIYNNTYNSGVYNQSSPNNKLAWHYYFTARSSYCPVVLTENGFISNNSDYAKIIDSAANDKKAAAIAKGVAEYFLSIQ